jgi:hypothetical protein
MSLPERVRGATGVNDDWSSALSGAMDVAKVALSSGAEMSVEETVELLTRLLAIIERTMPIDLQAQDIRVMRAKLVRDSLLQ